MRRVHDILLCALMEEMQRRLGRALEQQSHPYLVQSFLRHSLQSFLRHNLPLPPHQPQPTWRAMPRKNALSTLVPALLSIFSSMLLGNTLRRATSCSWLNSRSFTDSRPYTGHSIKKHRECSNEWCLRLESLHMSPMTEYTQIARRKRQVETNRRASSP